MKITPISLEAQVEDAAVQAGGLLQSKYGLWALAGISFLESALPIPLITDPFLVAYILANKHSALKGTLVTLIASIVGGVFAYVMAYSFYELIVATYLSGAIGEQFYTVVDTLQQGTFVVTVLGAVTPIPYTLVAYGVGFIKGSLLLFIIASFVGRGGRYAIVAFLTYSFGDQAIAIIRKRLLLFSVVTLALIGAYVAFTILKM